MVDKPKLAQFLPADDITDVFDTYTGEENVQTAQQRKLDDILNDLNDDSDDAELRVYRQPHGGKSSMNLLEVFPADKFTMSELWLYLRKNYGPGNYRIHIRQAGKVVANKLIEIEENISANKVPSQLNETASILQTVMDRMDRQQQQMMEILQNNRPEPQQSRTDFLQELVVYKQLFSGGGDSGNAVAQIKDTVQLLGELGMNIGGNEPAEDAGFTTLLEKVTDFATTAVQQPVNQPRGQKMSVKSILIKSGIKFLLNAASHNADRSLYAESVLDQIPEKTVREILTDSGAIEKLKKIEPKVGEYEPWFVDLGEHVKGMLGMPSKYTTLYDTSEDLTTINPEHDNATDIDSDQDNDDTNKPGSKIHSPPDT